MHDDDTCPWKQLAEEVMEDNRFLMEQQRHHTLYLEQAVADEHLRHGDPEPALEFLASADPHDYLNTPEV